MLLGVLADTHGYYHPDLDEVFADVDLILHAGDIGRKEILERLGRLSPVAAVWGNVDGPVVRARTNKHQHLECGGLTIRMTHIAGRPGRWQRGMCRILTAEPPDIFICGHSHILQIERVHSLGGMLFVNPGAAGRQGLHLTKTCVRLYLEYGQAVKAEVVHLDGAPDSLT